MAEKDKSAPPSETPISYIIRDGHPGIRCLDLHDLIDYLQSLGPVVVGFRAYPISGEPEEFIFDGQKNTLRRSGDDRFFDNLENFACYAFQCDTEGYTHTEHVDVVLLQ